VIKRREFHTFRMSYVLRGHWGDIILNVHAPTEDKGDDTKDSLCQELECIVGKFPKYS
jgi:hypothetical protein